MQVAQIDVNRLDLGARGIGSAVKFDQLIPQGGWHEAGFPGF
jgi:hypothetical protein